MMRVLPGLLLISCVLSCVPAAEDEPTGRRPASNNDDDTGDEGEGEGEGGEGEGESVPPPGACLDAGCPTILTLSANTTTFTPSTTIVISAVVTDPDGIVDLIGGVLLDPVTNATYGAFQTSAAEGAYELRLGWDEVNTTRAIDFAASASRPLRARFFDQAGHETLQDLTVTLTCEGPAACAGVCNEVRCGDVCVDDSFVDDDHCGRCDVACPSQLRCVDEDPTTRESIEPTCLCADDVSTSDDELDRCGDTCVDFNADEDNCGECGRQCDDGQVCFAGSCSCGSSEEGDSCSSPEGTGTCYRTEVEPSLTGDVCLALGAGRLVDGENAREGQRNQLVNGRVTVNGNTYDFRSGGYGNGSVPPGTYPITRHMDSRSNGPMTVGGVGYSFAMPDKYDPRVGANRTLLRIHPDGGVAGTLGCIGIVGSADVQRAFRSDMLAEIARNGGSFNLTVR